MSSMCMFGGRITCHRYKTTQREKESKNVTDATTHPHGHHIQQAKECGCCTLCLWTNHDTATHVRQGLKGCKIARSQGQRESCRITNKYNGKFCESTQHKSFHGSSTHMGSIQSRVVHKDMFKPRTFRTEA